MGRLSKKFYTLLITLLTLNSLTCAAVLEGELYTWHKITLTFDGPQSSEDSPATFLNNRLTVIFKHKEAEYTVAGFFAADGHAAQTHASAGNKWRVHFTADQPGKWSYKARFISGKRAALDGTNFVVYPLAGDSGSFVIEPTPLSEQDRDFRGQGRLQYVNGHYMQFAGSGRYFLKGGLGSPENLLAFNGFDGTWDAEKRPEFPSLGADQLHSFEPHRKHWKNADPFWINEKGQDSKGIIGLINYISGQGLNSIYLMPLTYQGDGCDVWPWINPEKRETFDVSKLDQWEMVFSHLQRNGIHIHILLSETENENLFEYKDGGGDFADTRKLYYRELIARFGHHLALSWNLGEENGWDDERGGPMGAANTDGQRKAFMEYISNLDAYNHPIKIHEIEIADIYTALLAYQHFDGPSLQRHENYNAVVQKFLELSRAAGRPWLVSMDEPLGWEYGLSPDADDPHHDLPRKEVLWGTYMAGGSGVEWYFGWQNNAPTSDLSAEDMTVRQEMWRQTRIARQFFETYIPFQDMHAMNNLVKGGNAFVFAREDSIYLVYLKEGGTAKLDLSAASGAFRVQWFNPRLGGTLQQGTVLKVTAGSDVSLGLPPASPQEDWAALIRR